MEWPKWKTENPQDKQTKTEKIRHSSKLIRPKGNIIVLYILLLAVGAMQITVLCMLSGSLFMLIDSPTGWVGSFLCTYIL